MAEFIIHRGSHQIGGMCAEIRTKTSRVIIDMGTNLPCNENNGVISDSELTETIFADEWIKSSENSDPKEYNAIIFTHYHADHIGLFDDILSQRIDSVIRKKVLNNHKIHMGKTAKDIKTNLFVQLKNDKHIEIYKNESLINTFVDKEPFVVGKEIVVGKENDKHQIKITPIRINHSALDSYMFFIEADGETMLYTGDFRNHGHFLKDKELFNKIDRLINGRTVDYLVTEGTMLLRKDAQNGKKHIFSETELEEEAIKCFEKSKYNFVLVSSTNFDSILSFYRAAISLKMPFICDDYQKKQLMTAAGCYVGITFSDEMIRTEFEYKNYKDSGFVMLVRATKPFKNAISRFEKAMLNEEYKIIYSMWNGYTQKNIEDPDLYLRNDDFSMNIQSFLDSFKNANVSKELDGYHTSGHASIECIDELICTVAPKHIIPMHSEATDEMKTMAPFNEYTPKFNVLLNDGDVLDLNEYCVTDELYSDICHLDIENNDISEQYRLIAEKVIEKLKINMEDTEKNSLLRKGWGTRFYNYAGCFLDKKTDVIISKFKRKESFLKEHPIEPPIPQNIQCYSPVGSGARTVQLRYEGALIAHLIYKGEKSGWIISPDSAAQCFILPTVRPDLTNFFQHTKNGQAK